MAEVTVSEEYFWPQWTATCDRAMPMKCQDDGHCFDAVGPLPPAFPGSDPAGQGKVYQSCQKARITSSSKATKGLELKVSELIIVMLCFSFWIAHGWL